MPPEAQSLVTALGANEKLKEKDFRAYTSDVLLWFLNSYESKPPKGGYKDDVNKSPEYWIQKAFTLYSRLIKDDEESEPEERPKERFEPQIVLAATVKTLALTFSLTVYSRCT